MVKKDVIKSHIENLVDGIENRYHVDRATVIEEEIKNGVRFGIHVKLGEKEMTFYRDYMKTAHNLYELREKGWYIKDKEEYGRYRTAGDVMKIFSQRVHIAFE